MQPQFGIRAIQRTIRNEGPQGQLGAAYRNSATHGTLVSPLKSLAPFEHEILILLAFTLRMNRHRLFPDLFGNVFHEF